ncbi:MAG: arginase [Alphaproteobacteria bacterium]|nr:MAG: arginase [Alphaproteobacteria bacterium]
MKNLERNRESECRRWRSMADLLDRGGQKAPLALLGAPLAEGSLTPGRCDLAPRAVRQALARISTYDLETGIDLAGLVIHDAGDLDLKLLRPEEAFEPIREAFTCLVAQHPLAVMIGGNNAITRPAVHGLAAGLGLPLQDVGLVTLDAHFDLRDTDCGLINGNPVRALIADGLPGGNIVQIGLQPFANTARMHAFAREQGIRIVTMAEVRQRGIARIMEEALDGLAGRVKAIHADFDIDVIERALLPGAPGARPGGMVPADFFLATRIAAAHPALRSVDLAEFDPALDVAEVSALTAARWLAELAAGFATRSGTFPSAAS